MRVVQSIALVFVLASSAPAYAQAPSQAGAAASSPETAARADDLFKAGMSDVKQQKWAEAEAKFSAALALNRSYDIAANLGHTQYRLGKYRDAAEHLSFAVKSWPVTGKKEQRELAVKRLGELRKALATVTVRVNVPGARVLVDGREVGQSPLADEVFVDPGSRAIEVKLAGYKDAKQTIEAAKGSSQEVALTMVADAPQAERTPKPDVKTKTGTEPETATAPGGPRKELIIGGIAASGVLVVAGIVFTAVSNGHASDAEKQRTVATQRKLPYPCTKPGFDAECADYQDTLGAQGTTGNLAIWSFILGGAIGAGTGIYALVASAPKETGGVRAVPVATANGGGVAIVGRW